MTTQEAIEWGGGTQIALAQRLSIKQPSVSNWGVYPPVEQQLRIQLMSGGQLLAEPDAVNPKMKAA